MRIKFLSTGAEQDVPNWYGKAEIAAGRAEEVKRAAPVWTPNWSVERDAANGYVFVRMTMGAMGEGAPGGAGTPRVVQTYAGDPDLIHDRRDSTGRAYCSSFGRPVPDEILKEYRKAWKNPDARRPTGPKTTDDWNKDMAEKLAHKNSLPLPAVSESEALEAHAAQQREKNFVRG